jgi:hypothetical protein
MKAEISKHIKNISMDIFEIRNVPVKVQDNKDFQNAFMKIYTDKVETIRGMSAVESNNPYASIYIEEETEILQDLDDYIESPDLKLLVKFNRI